MVLVCVCLVVGHYFFFCVIVFLFVSCFFHLSGSSFYHTSLFLFYSLVVVVEGISPSLCPFFLCG